MDGVKGVGWWEGGWWAIAAGGKVKRVEWGGAEETTTFPGMVGCDKGGVWHVHEGKCHRLGWDWQVQGAWNVEAAGKVAFISGKEDSAIIINEQGEGE